MASKTTTLPFGKAAFAVLGAAWTLVAGAVGALLKDEVRDRIAPPEASATIGTPRLQPGIRLREYLESVGETDPALSSGQRVLLDADGMVVFARIATKGFKAERLRVTGAVITEHGIELPELAAFQWSFVYKPAANTDSTVANIWLPRPDQPGRYKVVVRVHEARNLRFPGDLNLGPTRAERASKAFSVPGSS